jgi:2-keto-4-pentenoate hydratase
VNGLRIEDCAAALAAARMSALPVPELARSLLPQTIDEGYAVQAALSRILSDRGRGDRAGWKIGATTPGMQRYLGVDGPAFGRILSGDVHADGATISRKSLFNPGIECEIAVRIGAGSAGRRWTREDAGDLVAAVLPAMEIVENRYGDFLARGTPTLVADDFFHKACAIGAELADWKEIDLAAVAGRTLIAGEERGRGTGREVMGHPLEAVAWLANALAEQGESLKPGDLVLTGSVAPVIWVETMPAYARIELSGLGSVEILLG